MLYHEVYIHRFENTGSEPAFLRDIIRVNPGARIIDSRMLRPVFLNWLLQIGPDVLGGARCIEAVAVASAAARLGS